MLHLCPPTCSAIPLKLPNSIKNRGPPKLPQIRHERKFPHERNILKRCTRFCRSCLPYCPTCGAPTTPEMYEEAKLPMHTNVVVGGGSTKQHVLRFGLLFPDFDKDPTAPFTLYGTNFKKLFIERLDDLDKVVSRKRGVTVTTCVGIEPKSDETQEFQSLPLSQQARLVPNRECTTIEGQDLDNACNKSCTSACKSSIRRYSKIVLEQLGFGLGEIDQQKVAKLCVKRCSPDCSGAGRPFNFFVRFQR